MLNRKKNKLCSLQIYKFKKYWNWAILESVFDWIKIQIDKEVIKSDIGASTCFECQKELKEYGKYDQEND